MNGCDPEQAAGKSLTGSLLAANSDREPFYQRFTMFTITVERAQGGYEASLETEQGRFTRFSICEQDAIAFVCRRHGLNRDSIRVVRVY